MPLSLFISLIYGMADIGAEEPFIEDAESRTLIIVDSMTSPLIVEHRTNGAASSCHDCSEPDGRR